MNNQTCKQCAKPVVGRSDKQFCSDFCRNTFNNLKNRETFTFMRSVHSELSLNRRILKGLAMEGRSNLKRYDLEVRGFRFDLVTALVKKSNKTYRCCYEFAYEMEGDSVYLVTDPMKILPYTPPFDKN